MKTPLKLSLLAAAAAIIGTATAQADNQQMTNLLAIQRAQEWQTMRTTTVALYMHERGVGRPVMVHEERPDGDRWGKAFEFRFNAHGERMGVYTRIE
jgi:hypothetical protein